MARKKKKQRAVYRKARPFRLHEARPIRPLKTTQIIGGAMTLLIGLTALKVLKDL